MRDATIITNELVNSGLAAPQVALLMELILSMSTGMSGANPVESPEYRTLEKRRAWDRERKRKEREAKPPSANSTGFPPESTGHSTGNAELRLVEIDKKTKKLSGKERKKATRLQICARASEEDRAFAIASGIPPDRVDAEFAEFVDYWIGVSGSRGTKLDWPATWRNRVRQIANRFRNISAKPLTKHEQDRSILGNIRNGLDNFSTGGSGSDKQNPGLLRHDTGERPGRLRVGVGENADDIPTSGRLASN